jgi:hypothetical protein
MVFLWLFALGVSAHAATSPAPDPVLHPQPDAAPGSSSQPSKPPAQQPVTRPTTTVKPPAITEPLATTHAPAATQPATSAQAAVTASLKRKANPQQAHPAAKRRAHKARPARHHPAAPVIDPSRVQRAAAAGRRVALGTAHRVAAVLGVTAPAASSSPSLSDGELFATGTLLLLFVGAAGSVLRLSARMERFG